MKIFLTVFIFFYLNGNIYAKSNISNEYDKALNYLWKKEYKSAKKIFENLSSKGDVKSTFRLANMYEFGLGVKVDNYISHELYLKAARKNHIVSQYIVAMHYFRGRGTVSDFSKTLFWLKKAAKLGNKKAAYNLGYFYEAGIGVKKNPHLAKYWYKKAGFR